MTRLSAIERELIISFLADRRAPLFVNLEGSEGEPERLEAGKHSITFSKDGTITVRFPPPALSGWAGQRARVVFYFRKLGLSFSSRVDKTGSAVTLRLPQEISRLVEKPSSKKNVWANLYFSLSGRRDSEIICEASDAFPLFRAEVWKRGGGVLTAKALKEAFAVAIAQLSAEAFAILEKTGRLLYKGGGKIPEKDPFDLDLCVLAQELAPFQGDEAYREILSLPYSLYMPLDSNHRLCAVLGSGPSGSGPLEEDAVENLLAQTAAAAFLASTEETPMQDRALPLTLLFISDRRMVLGGRGPGFPLKTGDEYAAQISCATPQGKRVVDAAIAVGQTVSLGDGGETNSAALCAFTAIKAEDRRFLFEKLYGAVFK